MSEARRLTSVSDVIGAAATPGYQPSVHGIGIVHLGIGAFHRAHQAAYTDTALAAEGGDWRILGVSLRGTDVADALLPQNGLYTLIERGETVSARVIGSIASVLAASKNIQPVLDALAAPETRIVSLTVTEKAYGLDRSTGGVDPSHAAIAHDLAHPRQPCGAIGLVVEGLRLRRDKGLLPFTVLCCDNLPRNGALLRAAVIDFADRIENGLGDWIGSTVAFPSTMVDRITPASTQQTYDDAQQLTGVSDRAAIETEPFSQWVLEDHFPAGRPAWEKAGAIFTADVEPYERMKLRMLNGTHSLIAYAGFLCGRRHVRDAMADAPLTSLIDRHLQAAANTLGPIAGVDLTAYGVALKQRFANPAIAHETYQIAMDGTEKLPQRLLEPALETLHNGGDVRSFAFAVAAWMRYCLGVDEYGAAYALRDPREAAINSALAAQPHDAVSLSTALHGLEIFPEQLRENPVWRDAVLSALQSIVDHGMIEAVRRQAAT
jgi:fructuronate reductase